VLGAHAVLSAVLAIGYVVGGDTGVVWSLPNSFAKDVLFTILSALGAADVRRRGWTALVIAAGYAALVGGQVATLAWGGAPATTLPLAGEIAATGLLLGWMAIDIVFAIAFAALWFAAVRAGWALRYLSPVAFTGLVALADVLIEGQREVVPPEEVARNVDRYLDTLQARGKGRVHLALTAMAPVAVLGPEARREFLERRFVMEIPRWRFIRRYFQVLIRTASQMAYLGYYGDQRSWRSIGYIPYRHRLGGRAPEPADQRRPALRTLGAAPPGGHRYDVVVVGSGAAGGILAHRFAAEGRSVLVVERGPHAAPEQFTDDEVGQYLKLYNEGALQLATDFGLQVLQGMCVGGGTTINNALCLDPPDEVLAGWHAVDGDALKESIEKIRTWLEVKEIPAGNTTTAAKRFCRAVADLGLPGDMVVMSANLSDACRASGYCNIGCAYGARLATLDFVLPAAQREGRVDVIADVEVERIVLEGRRAVGVVGRNTSGEAVPVSAEKVVIAAGAIGSSWLLQRNRLGGDRVGEDLHFNINSPITADFEDEIDSFAGIQMSHAYVPRKGIPGYLVETWFNPPATQALAMPGWFRTHFDNMSRYRHMACAGVLVGTTGPGRVKPGRNAPQIDYRVSGHDRRRMAEGLATAGRIWLRAGARRVMPATFHYQEYRTPRSLDEFERDIGEPGELLLTSAHPQGGNAIGAVVDKDFRVTGTQNLYVCDASVFPSSVHVNPQLTVMGMAHYAAPRILA
jgi:choline dehydrogenase-like flavoprotein